MKRFVIENGHCKPFLNGSDKRSFLVKHYYIVSKSGVGRIWLSYFLILEKAYCEPCRLFANRASKNGNIINAIETHEQSEIHLDSHPTYQQWRLHDKNLFGA